MEEAFERARQKVGPAASRVDALRAMAEERLGRRPERRSAYQTSLTVCVACERTWQRAGGDLVEVSPALGGCAKCDGEAIGFTEVDEGVLRDGELSAAQATDGVTHVGREEARASAGATVESPADPGSAQVGQKMEHALEGPLGARALVRLASRIFGVPLKSMTPRLRAAVHARDRGRCAVPGCTNFRFVELHHQAQRRDGGPNTAENLYSLCSRHHRAIHDGLLAIEGSPSEGFWVHHAGGKLYGAPLSRDPCLGAGSVADAA